MNTIANCLVYNNRFATAKLNAEQLSPEALKEWTDAIASMHKHAYSIAVKCENEQVKLENPTIDKGALYDSIRAVLSLVGEVNGHRLYANDAIATLVVGYANRRVNADSPELQFVKSRIANNKRLLAIYEKTAGVNPEAIESLRNEIDTLVNQRDALLSEADNRHKVVTRTSVNAFRLDAEHLFARIITEQAAKTWDELEAEAEARRAERNARAKARKQAKKAQSNTAA